ncbi:hypothetical protein M514_16360 [Trichuris suis]|uniref:Uncharacterized protein n=1 Tax=Trichuris suis TaxID=68888 RepID=A0A085NPN2_9BILA|nr:hypothetical protein M514_16360 [Trichuris suis]
MEECIEANGGQTKLRYPCFYREILIDSGKMIRFFKSIRLGGTEARRTTKKGETHMSHERAKKEKNHLERTIEVA